MSSSEYAVPTGLSGHRGFGFYKYAAPTDLKTDGNRFIRDKEKNQT
ncbi:hypothetical protein QUF90_02410 [Desulfococcaceae bacterium HSG9]|nr:hypothetical protein [Desulfococcaceae bacterium HSG9]